MAEEKKEDKGNGDARDPVEGQEIKDLNVKSAEESKEPKVLLQIVERPNGSIYVNGLLDNMVMAMGWLAISMFQIVDYHKQKAFEKNMPQRKIVRPGFGGILDKFGRKKH